MDLLQYKKDFINNLRNDAAINHCDPDSQFVTHTFDLLREDGEFIEPLEFFVGKPGKQGRIMRLDGYFFDDSENSLSLILCDFDDTYDLATLTNSQIDVLSKQITNFLDEACNGDLTKYFDDADDTLKLGRMIRFRLDNTSTSFVDILKIKLYILTDKKLSDNVKILKEASFNGKKVVLNVWALERFFDFDNQSNSKPILLELNKEFHSEGIPCVRANVGENLGYDAYMAIIPGSLLADIYIEHGSKVLEGNVRAFLGTSSAKGVNAGIKRTIKIEPSKFFIYNNGVAATAAKIKYCEKNGKILITEIEDFQIINGGQTTATLAAAKLKKEDNYKLDGIFVPMKLTVIEDRESMNDDGIRFYDQMVQSISRYANTQNPVKAADFFSNSPYHVIMEKMSKMYLAPPANGSPIPTGWYYERARKKYNQEQIKIHGLELLNFLRKFPKKQVITKEIMAKCIYCIECKPSIVAKGSNWVMKDYGSAIDDAYKKDKSIFSEAYFKRCIDAVILFRTVDDIVAKAPWYPKGGYKLNIVPYTIAKIMDSIPKGYTIDWVKIWQKQMLYPSFIREVEIVAKMTNNFINNSGGMIVTEYCKALTTWEKYKAVEYEFSDEFLHDLIAVEEMKSEQDRAKKDQRLSNNVSAEIEVVKLGSPFWRRLLEEGTKRNILTYKEQSLLQIATTFDSQHPIIPTTAQAKAILMIKQKLDDEGII